MLIKYFSIMMAIEEACSCGAKDAKGQSSGALSSVGRASRLHREGREFESLSAHHYPVIFASYGGFIQHNQKQLPDTG
jgi:hypothetical protein